MKIRGLEVDPYHLLEIKMIIKVQQKVMLKNQRNLLVKKKRFLVNSKINGHLKRQEKKNLCLSLLRLGEE
jgi:hypothetical protein